MKFALSTSLTTSDVLFLSFFKSETLNAKMKSALGAKTAKQVEARFKSKDFEGDEGQTLTLFPEGSKWKRVVLLGRGKNAEAVPQSTEFLGAKISDCAKAAKATSITILTDEADFSELAYGFVLGTYEFKRYKAQDKKTPSLEKVTFVLPTVKKGHCEQLTWIESFEHVSPSVRDLINTCAGDLNPMDMAKIAEQVGKKSGFKVTVLDLKKLRKLGCHALAGVGQGASSEPCMVILEYRHKSKAKEPNIAFIGKGITFDTGGLNLKPTGHIETMNQDMTGAAIVLGTLQTLAENKVPGYFLGVMACAENAISDRAQHPGDVVKAYNGKTIEVNNTDAEGRVVLADALSYTEKNYKPKRMIDIATLTGAVTVALGYTITGVLGTEQKFLDCVLDCAKRVHERMWPLPLDEDFVKLCKGNCSDLKNTTDGVRAGAIMGAAFLKHFVEKTPWVHLDVGGTAWVEHPTPSTKYGATTAGLRTLIELAKHYAD